MVQKSETKLDRRVLYTKMFLKESLLELMKEKPIDKITPTELCRHANINRNTFYAHYYTTRDLLVEIEEEFSSQMIESLGETLPIVNTLDLLENVCRIVYEKKEFCKVLLSKNGDAAFLQNVILIGRDQIIKNWETMGLHLNDEKTDYFRHIRLKYCPICRETAEHLQGVDRVRRYRERKRQQDKARLAR